MIMEDTIEREKRAREPTTVEYADLAKYLAENYMQMLKERTSLKQRLAGNWTYTKSMAVEDLVNTTVAYDGDHVQSSNISRQTERLALLLTDEFMAKKQAEMDREKATLIQDLAYLDWKINVVEVVMNERMRDLQRPVFKALYVEHKTYRETVLMVQKKYQKRIFHENIVSIRESIILLINQELLLRDEHADSVYMNCLEMEVNEHGSA